MRLLSLPLYYLRESIEVPGSRFAVRGRTNVSVDFEDDIPNYDAIWSDATRNYKVETEDKIYYIYGLLPANLEKDNIWNCSIDYFKCEDKT